MNAAILRAARRTVSLSGGEIIYDRPDGRFARPIAPGNRRALLASARADEAQRIATTLIGDGAAVERGWGLSGPGPARFGWWRRYPTGLLVWPGRSIPTV